MKIGIEKGRAMASRPWVDWTDRQYVARLVFPYYLLILVVAIVLSQLKPPAWDSWMVSIILLVTIPFVYASIDRIRAQRPQKLREIIADAVIFAVCFLVVFYGGDALFDFGLTSDGYGDGSTLSGKMFILAAVYMAIAGFALSFGASWLAMRFRAKR